MSQGDKVRYKSDITLQAHYATNIKLRVKNDILAAKDIYLDAKDYFRRFVYIL